MGTNTRNVEMKRHSSRFAFIICIYCASVITCGCQQSKETKNMPPTLDWMTLPPINEIASENWEVIPHDHIYEIDGRYVTVTTSLLTNERILALTKGEAAKYSEKPIAAAEGLSPYLVRAIWAENCKMKVYRMDKTIWVRCAGLGKRAKGFVKKPVIVLLPFLPTTIYVDRILAL
jgi:hypothetical protein